MQNTFLLVGVPVQGPENQLVLNFSPAIILFWYSLSDSVAFHHHHADILVFLGSSVPLLYKNTLKWFSFHTFLTSKRKRLIELEHIFLMVLCNDLLYKHLDCCTIILWTNYTSKMNKNTEDLKSYASHFHKVFPIKKVIHVQDVIIVYYFYLLVFDYILF